MPTGVYQHARKRYNDAFVARVRHLYASGLTQVEVARVLDTTQKVVWLLMRRHEIARRPAAKRDQRGWRNHMWRGDDAGYQAMHRRVAQQRGAESLCAVCGATSATATYEWANLTGNYGDINDYERMCRSCHRRYDNARRKKAA